MAPPDFPDFMLRGLPSDAVEVDADQAVAFAMWAWASVPAGSLQQFDFGFTDANYIYQLGYILISPMAMKEHVDYIYFYSVPGLVGAGAGYKEYKLYDNPALQYINGDVFSVFVRNADAASQYIVVGVTGIRYTRPVGWGHPPYVQFHGLPVAGAHPLTVQFTDDSYNTPTNWSWSFGDGGWSGLQSPSHIYVNAGTFTVTLWAWNANGWDVYQRTNYIVVT